MKLCREERKLLEREDIDTFTEKWEWQSGGPLCEHAQQRSYGAAFAAKIQGHTAKIEQRWAITAVSIVLWAGAARLTTNNSSDVSIPNLKISDSSPENPRVGGKSFDAVILLAGCFSAHRIDFDVAPAAQYAMYALEHA